MVLYEEAPAASRENERGEVLKISRRWGPGVAILAGSASKNLSALEGTEAPLGEVSSWIHNATD